MENKIEEKDPYVLEGDPILVEYKNQKTKYAFYLHKNSNWGNPWDFTIQNNGFEVDSQEEAVSNFKKWLWGEDFLDILQKKRKWLLLNIKYLKGKNIAYDYKPYAEVLVNAIDKNIKLPDIELIPNTIKKDDSMTENKSTKKEQKKVKSIF